MKLELVATSAFGLEAVVRREIESLGYKVIRTEDGRVTYMGDERAIVRSNLWLRTADRVYLRMGEFKAETFEEFKAELVEKGFLNPTDEDVLSYALFPQVAEEFFQKHYQKVTAYKR